MYSISCCGLSDDPYLVNRTWAVHGHKHFII